MVYTNVFQRFMPKKCDKFSLKKLKFLRSYVFFCVVVADNFNSNIEYTNVKKNCADIRTKILYLEINNITFINLFYF